MSECLLKDCTAVSTWTGTSMGEVKTYCDKHAPVADGFGRGIKLTNIASGKKFNRYLDGNQ